MILVIGYLGIGLITRPSLLWWVTWYMVYGALFSLKVPRMRAERLASGDSGPDHVPTWWCVVAGLLWLPLVVLEFAARVW